MAVYGQKLSEKVNKSILRLKTFEPPKHGTGGAVMRDMAIWILTAIPRFVVCCLKISHKHKYIYNGSFDGGLWEL